MIRAFHYAMLHTLFSLHMPWLTFRLHYAAAAADAFPITPRRFITHDDYAIR